jgi:hypothetical protein
MNEKNYKRKLEFQKKMVSRLSEQNESLKLEIDKLKLDIVSKKLLSHFQCEVKRSGAGKHSKNDFETC